MYLSFRCLQTLSQLPESPLYVIVCIKYSVGFTFLNRSILESSDPLWCRWVDLVVWHSCRGDHLSLGTSGLPLLFVLHPLVSGFHVFTLGFTPSLWLSASLKDISTCLLLFQYGVHLLNCAGVPHSKDALFCLLDNKSVVFC